MSCFQSAVVALRTVYPKAVVWSEENLVAVACGAAVIILNPHNPKVRGVITVPSSKRFPTGKIDVDGGGADLLNGCLLPYHLSRETRPCVRSISWSPAGLAKDAGLYQDKILQIRVVSEDHENLGEKNNWQIVSSSFYEGDPLEEVTEDCLPLISAQQYASRNEMLMSLIIAWSPILETSGNDVAFPSSSSNCCSILAVGGKCGKISLWRVRAPECYSTDNAGHASEVRLVGLEKVHDSWITAISWVGYGSNDSKTQFALATGSSDGSVKIWLVNGEKLLKASEVINDSLSLLREVATVDSSMISVLSLTVPARSPTKLFLAIGKSSGSFELCTLDTSTDKFDNVGCYNAHDSTVSGLAWAFDGRCLYSCSQNNSLKSWIFVGDSLSEVSLPRSSPGLKSSTEFAHALDSCFGLSVSPGNLAVAVVRRYDSDLLDPMYEGRSHKSAVEFLWVGGQQLDPSVVTSSEIAKETFPGFPEKELTWWEMNILGRLNKYENPNRLLNIFDIVAALRAFKQSAPKYVEHILLKCLASCLGSKCEISRKLLSEAPKLLTMHSSRQLHLINIISREVVLKEFMTENVSGKEHVLEGLSGDKKEEINLWMDLLLSCEKELLLRLVSISISAEEFSGVGGDGLPQMKQWLLQNVKDEYKFLAAEIREVKKRKLEETSEHEVHDRCHFCTGVVPFESTEYATCSGSIDKTGTGFKDGAHHFVRHAQVSFRFQVFRRVSYSQAYFDTMLSLLRHTST
ncbi:hypothetical protein SASPL_122213 [Salvia splendens]|uniref:Transcription factor IIIC 90kDa subunit N-terminal domain-containing protein n=1 Tax=Salvia splendens TaxID=180675 RepID=A0A8X8ZSS8_SALSN|nr:hypothetical protein SASPL_122213 [Salvia splendens]